MTKKRDLPPGDIQRLLSPSMAKSSQSGSTKSVVIDGVTYTANAHIQYRASSHHHVRSGALVDRGANGGIAGGDVRVINRTGRQVDVQGIDNHQIVDIPIVTAGAVVKTQRGEVIIILHQYAYTGKGKTIHSSGQMEWHKQLVDDKSLKVGGKQQIRTLDGYIIPLDIKSGLPYVRMRPYTDDEWDTLPHVILTGDDNWNPSVLDHELIDDETWYDAVSVIYLVPWRTILLMLKGTIGISMSLTHSSPTLFSILPSSLTFHGCTKRMSDRSRTANLVMLVFVHILLGSRRLR